MTRLSVLDLTPIIEGGDAALALSNGLDLARAAERLGYHRYWVAEHHNVPGIASAATSVVIANIAAGTSTIRVGAGGIMLPNHAPLMVAEQFGTLEALHPGRIDLGIGRASGTDPRTAQALRRNLAGTESFAEDLVELICYFGAPQPDQVVRAYPGSGLSPPIWILGSSIYSAQLAAVLGLPYAFASQFAPAELDAALAIYRQRFTPSAHLEQPYVMVGAMVTAAETDAEAEFLASSMHQVFVNGLAGRRGPFPPPVEGYYAGLDSRTKSLIDQALTCSIVGGPEAVKSGLTALIQRTGANEVIATNQVFDHAKRVASYEILASAGGIGGTE